MTNSAEAPLGKVLAYYKEKCCKGLGEVMLNAELMDPIVQNLFRCAERVGLPVVFERLRSENRRFRPILGISFVEYVSSIRLERAKEMLSGSAIKIKDISGQVGFTNPNYFGIWLRKTQG